jgi:hypothetical protein
MCDSPFLFSSQSECPWLMAKRAGSAEDIRQFKDGFTACHADWLVRTINLIRHDRIEAKAHAVPPSHWEHGQGIKLCFQGWQSQRLCETCPSSFRPQHCGTRSCSIHMIWLAIAILWNGRSNGSRLCSHRVRTQKFDDRDAHRLCRIGA